MINFYLFYLCVSLALGALIGLSIELKRKKDGKFLNWQTKVLHGTIWFAQFIYVAIYIYSQKTINVVLTYDFIVIAFFLIPAIAWSFADLVFYRFLK